MFNVSTQAERLSEIADHVLQRARKLGASQAEMGASSESGLSVNVRMGEVETVEFTRDRGILFSIEPDKTIATDFFFREGF